MSTQGDSRRCFRTKTELILASFGVPLLVKVDVFRHVFEGLSLGVYLVLFSEANKFQNMYFLLCVCDVLHFLTKIGFK